MRPWSPAEVADSAGFQHAQVLGDYVAIPNRRVTQLGADGARSGRPVHWLDCACAAVRWPRSCTVGTGLGPSQAPCRPDGLSSGLPLCTSREDRERVCTAHTSFRLKAFAPHNHQMSPVHPPRSTACRPSATSSCPARSSASTASGRCEGPDASVATLRVHVHVHVHACACLHAHFSWYRCRAATTWARRARCCGWRTTRRRTRACRRGASSRAM